MSLEIELLYCVGVGDAADFIGVGGVVALEPPVAVGGDGDYDQVAYFKAEELNLFLREQRFLILIVEIEPGEVDQPLHMRSPLLVDPVYLTLGQSALLVQQMVGPSVSEVVPVG